MAKVEWIKLTTDMFSNPKIKYLRTLPEGNNIILIWCMLLTMAGRCNAGGMIFLTENIPYTPEMLAEELKFEVNTVKLALEALARLEMINIDEDIFCIAGWEEHQNAEGLDKIREQNRERQARFKAKKKQLLIENTDNVIDNVTDNVTGNVTDNVTVTQGNATEEDKEEEEDKDIDIKNNRVKVDYQKIANMYNDTCVSLQKVTSLSDARRKAIKARFNKYDYDDFQRLFDKAQASDFLTGQNNRNWRATFDWLLKDNNLVKVLDGNYDNKRGQPANTGHLPDSNLNDLDDLF